MDTLKRAIRLQVEENKAPAMLALKVGDVEKEQRPARPATPAYRPYRPPEPRGPCADPQQISDVIRGSGFLKAAIP